MKADSVKVAKSTIADDKKINIASIASGILIAYAITCIVIIGYALLITYASFTGEQLPLILSITCLGSVIVAGFDSARGASSKGWLWGVIAGAIYAVILVAIGVWVEKGLYLDARSIALIILAIAGGGVGGVIGINFKKK